MPITRQITETHTRTLTLMTLAEYAERTLPPDLVQPLVTRDNAITSVGWDLAEQPKCCGNPVEIETFIGSAYAAHCETCGKFIFDITGPVFGNSWVSVPDSEKIDLESDYEHRWVFGTKRVAQ